MKFRNIKHFERKPRDRKASERKCWTCKQRSRHVSTQCPRRLRVVGKEQKEKITGPTLYRRSGCEGTFVSSAKPQEAENPRQARANEVSLERVMEAMGEYFSSGTVGEMFEFRLPKALLP